MIRYVVLFMKFCYSDVDQIEAGIGDKLSLFVQYFCAFIAGFIVGFVKGWKLTLVILSVSPLLAFTAGLMGRVGTDRIFVNAQTVVFTSVKLVQSVENQNYGTIRLKTVATEPYYMMGY